MVLYPCDSFENQILIKLNKQETNLTKEVKEVKEAKEAEETNLEKYSSKTNNLDYLESSENSIINTSNQIENCNIENEIQECNNSKNEKNSFKYLTNSLETIECNNDGSIELNNLDNIAENTEPIELKTHEAIYLEIYKKAKQKAKEIRKNAIEAFLEAKNIKMKYNLNTILDDSSSDEENELLNLD
jgi:hypothetical protein